jgi:hypothetical protein
VTGSPPERGHDQTFSVRDPAADCDDGEPAPSRRTNAYVCEYEEMFGPMRRLFGMVREIALPSPTRSALSGR